MVSEQVVARVEQLRAAVAANPDDMQERAALAAALVTAGELDEALREHVWLWRNMLAHQADMYPVRLSFFVGQLEDLLSAHPPARAEISMLRDEVTPPAERLPSFHAFVDWLKLNEVLGESERGLRWYDALPERPLLDPGFEGEIIALLVAAGRWAEAGALHTDPVAHWTRATKSAAASERRAAQSPMSYVAATSRKQAAKRLREAASNLVRALRAAGREEPANTIAADARRLDPSLEMAAAIS